MLKTNNLTSILVPGTNFIYPIVTLAQRNHLLTPVTKELLLQLITVIENKNS